MKEAEEKLEMKKQRFEAEITALDGCGKRSRGKTGDGKAGGRENEGIVLRDHAEHVEHGKIVGHLMSVEGGCHTEEVAAADANHIINQLNTVVNEAAKRKKPPPRSQSQRSETGRRTTRTRS